MLPAGAATAVLHPLLHSNTSDLSEQRYSSTFTGDEFFLTDHQVRTDGHAGQKVLPGVAYLEMARAAIEHALPARSESTVLELHDTVWAQPIVVSEKKQVNIALAANDDEPDRLRNLQPGDGPGDRPLPGSRGLESSSGAGQARSRTAQGADGAGSVRAGRACTRLAPGWG